MWNWLGITNDPKPSTDENSENSQITEKTVDDSKGKEATSTEKVAEAATNLTSIISDPNINHFYLHN